MSTPDVKDDNACPMCSARGGVEIERIPFERIWTDLADTWNVRFTADVLHAHTPAAETALTQCSTCGLQYFTPARAGTDQFYQQLMTFGSCYYNEHKWDFRAAAAYVPRGADVLDIGCGGGAFLAMMERRGCRAIGLDTNPAAVAAARGRGLDARCEMLGSFAARHTGEFDVATMFQVLEHVADVRPMIEDALSCLRPGGRLLFTVPNRLRPLREDFGPLDCPPHHMSRWADAQCRWIADHFPCRLVDVCFEPASLHEVRTLLRSAVAGTSSDSVWARVFGRLAVTESLYRLYRRVGLLDRWRFHGMSFLGVLEKQTSPATACLSSARS